MIELFVLIILIVFIAYTLFTFTTYVSLGINIVLLIILAILVNRDLKKKEMHRYYLISLLLTAIVFILSDYSVFYTLLRIMSRNLFLSIITQAMLLIYAFANLSMLLAHSAKDLIKKFR